MFGLRLLSLWVLLFVSVVIMVLLVVYLFAVVTDLVWLFWFLWWVGGVVVAYCDFTSVLVFVIWLFYCWFVGDLWLFGYA